MTYYNTGSISGRMFSDSNHDDTEKDANGHLEHGIGGQKVILLNESGHKIAETTTAHDGSYKFDGLGKGDYTVKFPTSVDGNELVEEDVGNTRFDSDANEHTGKSFEIHLDRGEDVCDVDAGYKADPPDSSITGRMFLDTNMDDTENADSGFEPGIAGKTVELLDENGNVVDTATTDDNGVYKFEGVEGGEYSIRFPTDVDGGGLVEKDVGNVRTDSDADQNTGETIKFTVVPGCDYSELDAGYDKPMDDDKDCIDFDDQSKGTVIDSEYTTSDGVTISAISNGHVNKAMIFDTAHPTGGDHDLATNNLGKVLIISEDGDSSDPDDEADGGILRFDFDFPVTLEEVTVLDVEEGAEVRLFDKDGNVLNTVNVVTGNNGQKVVDLGDTAGVARMDIELGGSGAVDNVCFIPCFTPGTLIATPDGERLVENLREGDRILTRDNGIQEIRWTGSKAMSGIDLIKDPSLKPILIKAGALGHGLPERDMIVSPNHRVLMANDRTQLYFEESEVLASAKDLVGIPGIQRLDVMSTTYIHFMFDRHEVVLSNGAWTESFQPGDWSLRGIDTDQRDEILTLFPELKEEDGLENYTAARKSLKRYEAKLLTV